MSLRQGLGQHAVIRQDLRINPRLYQAMDLLYMPLLDLQKHLRQELLENPFLDLDESDDGTEIATAEVAREREQASTAKEETNWEDILLGGFEGGGWKIGRASCRERVYVLV